MIYENEPASVYHASPAPGLGFHALLESDPEAGGSLRKFHARYIEGFSRPESEALLFGRAAHARILEKRNLEDGRDPEFIMHPATYPTGKMGEEKPWRRGAAYCDEWEKKNAGKSIIKPAWVETINRMNEAAEQDPEVADLMSKGKPEVVIRHPDPQTGLIVQCRFDWLRIEDRLFADLKSTAEETMSRFPREALNFNYDRCIAWYSRRLAQELNEPWPSDRIQGRIIASMKVVPWSAQVFRFGPERLATADAKNQAAMSRLASAWNDNCWPDDTGGIITID